MTNGAPQPSDSPAVPSQPGRSLAADRGFVLVMVLWLTGFFAVAVAVFTKAVVTDLRIAANTSSAAEAEALADAGVSLAIVDLVRTSGRRAVSTPFGRDGRTVFRCRLGQGDVAVSVQDVGGRIDLSTASPRLLAALLAGHGVGGEEAVRLAARILDWRDRDDVPLDNGAEARDYVAAGTRIPPRNAPFDTIEELGNVLGLAPWLVGRLREDVTIHSGQAGIDPDVASPETIARIRAGAAELPGGGLALSSGPPAEFVTRSERRVFVVKSEGSLANGAVFVREAVVQTGARRGRAYSIRAWRRGERNAVPASSVNDVGAC